MNYDKQELTSLTSMSDMRRTGSFDSASMSGNSRKFEGQPYSQVHCCVVSPSNKSFGSNWLCVALYVVGHFAQFSADNRRNHRYIASKVNGAHLQLLPVTEQAETHEFKTRLVAYIYWNA